MSDQTILLQIELDGRSRRLELNPSNKAGVYEADVEGQTMQVEARLLRPGVLSLIIGDRVYRCVLDEGPEEIAVQLEGRRFPFRVEDPRSLSARRGNKGAASGRQTIKAPMPGRIVRLLVEVGDHVEAHQGVIVIEAMKMQNELKASRAGKIVEVRVAPGATVAAGETLVVIE